MIWEISPGLFKSVKQWSIHLSINVNTKVKENPTYSSFIKSTTIINKTRQQSLYGWIDDSIYGLINESIKYIWEQ